MDAIDLMRCKDCGRQRFNDQFDRTCKCGCRHIQLLEPTIWNIARHLFHTLPAHKAVVELFRFRRVDA